MRDPAAPAPARYCAELPASGPCQQIFRQLSEALPPPQFVGLSASAAVEARLAEGHACSLIGGFKDDVHDRFDSRFVQPFLCQGKLEARRWITLHPLALGNGLGIFDGLTKQVAFEVETVVHYRSGLIGPPNGHCRDSLGLDP